MSQQSDVSMKDFGGQITEDDIPLAPGEYVFDHSGLQFKPSAPKSTLWSDVPMKQAIQFNHDLFSCVGEIGLDGPVLSISMTLAGMIFGPLIGWMEEGHGLTLKIALNSIKGDVKFVVKSKSGGRNELWVQLKVTHENEGSIEENHQIASF